MIGFIRNVIFAYRILPIKNPLIRMRQAIRSVTGWAEKFTYIGS